MGVPLVLRQTNQVKPNRPNNLDNIPESLRFNLEALPKIGWELGMLDLDIIFFEQTMKACLSGDEKFVSFGMVLLEFSFCSVQPWLGKNEKNSLMH